MDRPLSTPGVAEIMLTHLRGDVWQIDCSGVNAYLADDDGALTLIDAGTPRDGDRIRTAVGQAGYDVRDIERILVTHYDVDHVGSLATLAEASGSPACW